MAEYIKREELSEYITKRINASNTGSVTEACYKAVLQDLLEMPAADVAPVVHGIWVNSYEDRASKQQEHESCIKCIWRKAYNFGMV